METHFSCLRNRKNSNEAGVCGNEEGKGAGR